MTRVKKAAGRVLKVMPCLGHSEGCKGPFMTVPEIRFCDPCRKLYEFRKMHQFPVYTVNQAVMAAKARKAHE